MRYELATACRFEGHHPTLGHVEANFKAGVVEPRSEQDEFALAGLVAAGIASPAKSRTKEE